MERTSFLLPSQAQYKNAYTIVEQDYIDPKSVYEMTVVMGKFNNHLQMKIEWILGGVDYFPITPDSVLADCSKIVEVDKVQIRVITQARLESLIAQKLQSYGDIPEESKEDMFTQARNEVLQELDRQGQLKRWVVY